MVAFFDRKTLSGLAPTLGFVLLSALVGFAGIAFVQTATRQLLEAEARIDAQQWSRDLARTIPDLPTIITGGEPTTETLTYLDRMRHLGQITSFRVYDAKGQLKLSWGSQSPGLGQDQRIEDIDARLAEAARSGQQRVILRQAVANGEAQYLAIGAIPVMVEFRTIGTLVVSIDQSSRQALFFAMASKVSIAVGILLLAAPVFGFWYRTRQRALVEQTIETMSQRDQLTGLINKTAFIKSIDHKLAGLDSGHGKSAVIFLELSGLNAILQTFGQDAEEHLLRTTASRILEQNGEVSDAAAISHSVFAVFVQCLSDPIEVLSLAKAMTVQLGECVEWREQKLPFQVHAGIALFSNDGETAAALMRSAELALHSAQEQGSPGYGFFNPDIARDTRRRAAVQRAVADATARQSFRLDYQPIYSFRTGELSGFEALIRLHDDELGSVSPAEFIPVAEQMGLINSIGAWCLREACAAAAEWPVHLIVSVNLSPSQFLTGTLINDVRGALESNRFPAYRLEVEITEGTLLNDSELVMSQLRILRDMGVAVALDDFGTGYSSLAYLWKFPFSKLKIDRSFVQALDESQSAKGILRSIVKLGHGLGLTVTAEGIENAKQCNTLRDMGCDLAQGYLLDRPARATDVASIIMRNFANGLSRRGRETLGQGKSAA